VLVPWSSCHHRSCGLATWISTPGLNSDGFCVIPNGLLCARDFGGIRKLHGPRKWTPEAKSTPTPVRDRIGRNGSVLDVSSFRLAEPLACRSARNRPGSQILTAFQQQVLLPFACSPRGSLLFCRGGHSPASPESWRDWRRRFPAVRWGSKRLSGQAGVGRSLGTFQDALGACRAFWAPSWSHLQYDPPFRSAPADARVPLLERGRGIRPAFPCGPAFLGRAKTFLVPVVRSYRRRARLG